MKHKQFKTENKKKIMEKILWIATTKHRTWQCKKTFNFNNDFAGNNKTQVAKPLNRHGCLGRHMCTRYLFMKWKTDLKTKVIEKYVEFIQKNSFKKLNSIGSHLTLAFRVCQAFINHQRSFKVFSAIVVCVVCVVVLFVL